MVHARALSWVSVYGDGVLSRLSCARWSLVRMVHGLTLSNGISRGRGGSVRLVVVVVVGAGDDEDCCWLASVSGYTEQPPRAAAAHSRSSASRMAGQTSDRVQTWTLAPHWSMVRWWPKPHFSATRRDGSLPSWNRYSTWLS